MIIMTRRVLLAVAAMLTAVADEDEAAACSLVASEKPRRFSDEACRDSLGAMIALINRAPTLSDADLAKATSQMSINYDSDVADPIMNYPNHSPIEDTELLRAWTLSGDRRDRKPIAVREVNLLKQNRGIALYQFTLRRERFFPEVTEEEAATDSCGMAEPAHFSAVDTSYLGTFRNNRLRRVSAFEAWLVSL